MEGLTKFGACAVIFLLTLIKYETDAISCYQCTYADEGCNDEFKEGAMSSYLKDCDPKYNYCRKISFEVNDEDPLVTRQCAEYGDINGEEGEEDCARKTGTYKVKRYSCLCNDKDGCNSAETVKISMVVPLIAVFIASIFL